MCLCWLLAVGHHIGAELATILFLAAPHELWMCLVGDEKTKFDLLRNVGGHEMLSHEVESVNKQLKTVISHSVSCAAVKKKAKERRG